MTVVVHTPLVDPAARTVSAWSSWSPCTATSPAQTRSRTVVTQPANGGVQCPTLLETRSNVCVVDCAVSQWGEWSGCDGGVTQTRSRSVITVPFNGGEPCPLTVETQPCVAQCEVSAWGQWSPWTSCVGDTRSRTRTRTVTAPGSNCPDLAETHSEACSGDDADCAVGAWSAWTQCSASCGGGTQVSSRPVVVPQRGDGLPCDALTRSRTCNTHTCGGGGGDDGQCDGCWPGTAGPCQHPSNTVCYSYFPGTTVCPGGAVTCGGTGGGGGDATDCVPWAWSEWGSCTAAVDGIQVRTRDVATPATNGGTVCAPLEESQPCGADPAGDDDDDTPPPPVDCVLSPWSDWLECSAPCGGGTRRADRTIVTAPANGGAPCGLLTRTEACNTQACGGGGGDQCSSCWPGTSGPCRAANTVCYGHMDAAAQVCPPGTAACASVGSASVPAAVMLTVQLRGVRADYIESTYGRFALAAAVATAVGGGLTPDQVVLQATEPVESGLPDVDACRVSFAIVTPAASRVSAGEAAVVLAQDATLERVRDDLAGRWVGVLALESVAAPAVVPAAQPEGVTEVAIGAGGSWNGAQAGSAETSADGRTAVGSPTVTVAAVVAGVVVVGVAVAVWRARRARGAAGVRQGATAMAAVVSDQSVMALHQGVVPRRYSARQRSAGPSSHGGVSAAWGATTT